MVIACLPKHSIELKATAFFIPQKNGTKNSYTANP